MLQRPDRQTAIVVDDDAMIRAILRSTLSSIGLDVHLASHGYEAVGLAGRIQATLMLLDLAMPGLDGVSACSQIRALPGYDAVPIIVLTAALNPLIGQAAMEAGATMVLRKPFQPASLLQALSPFCQISNTARTAIARNASQARSIAMPPQAGLDQRIWR
jgi:two-component system chemotaxis response regulator CheY